MPFKTNKKNKRVLENTEHHERGSPRVALDTEPIYEKIAQSKARIKEFKILLKREIDKTKIGQYKSIIAGYEKSIAESKAHLKKLKKEGYVDK